MAISDETRLRPANKLPGRQLAGETVVVDPRRRKVFLMNPVGGEVWSQVERSATVAEMVAAVVRRFEVDSVRARADVDLFVNQLLEAGLAETA